MKSQAPASGTLFDALVFLNPTSSKTTIKSWIKEGRIQVDNTLVRTPSHPVKKGQLIELTSKPKFLDEGIKIIYEDRYLIALEKPEGVLSVKARFETQNTVHQFLKNKYGRVVVVHRLDQGTSGVMVFAKEEEAAKRLKEIFKKHSLIRKYYAFVEGKLEGTGTWTSELLEDDRYHVHIVPEKVEGSQTAITHYKVLKKIKGFTLVEFILETGRKNQIRVQASEMGHPIAGDDKYGAKADPLGRLALHAGYLEIPHPYTRKPLKLISPLPTSFKKLAPDVKI